MKQYIAAFNAYYESVNHIHQIIDAFNSDYQLPFSDTAQYGFIVKPAQFSKTMLTPNFYREDVRETINYVVANVKTTELDAEGIKKGDEIGSAFYQDEGVPFIKTSDIMNYDIDHEPDCYCSESFLAQLEQEIKLGDVLFAKDGKPGEVAFVQEDVRAVISSGIVKYPRTKDEGYWVFLLLASRYGDAHFKKWFVIASTMLHLRADFFSDFKIPAITDEISKSYIRPLEEAFKKKTMAYKTMVNIKNLVEDSYTNETAKLSLT